MDRILIKIGAILALIIGAMAIFAGGKVLLLGIDPGYTVIDWMLVLSLLLIQSRMRSAAERRAELKPKEAR